MQDIEYRRTDERNVGTFTTPRYQVCPAGPNWVVWETESGEDCGSPFTDEKQARLFAGWLNDR